MNTPTRNIAGIYLNFKIDLIEMVKIEIKNEARINPFPATMLYLRNDSTYVLGYCDNQISEVGRYRFIGDSVYFFDRFDLFDRIELTSESSFYDVNNDAIHFRNTNKKYKKANESIKNKIVPLKKNTEKYGHYGFLRDQEMRLDSIINYYELHSVEEQLSWSDSVINALEKK